MIASDNENISDVRGLELGRILICEDERIVAKHLSRTLSRAGHTVVGIAERREKALELAVTHSPDLALMDIRIKGDSNGIAVAEELDQRYGIPSIFLTAHGDAETFTRAKKTRPLGYLLKPFKDREVEIAVELGLERSRNGSTPAESTELQRSQRREHLLEAMRKQETSGSFRAEELVLEELLREAVLSVHSLISVNVHCRYVFPPVGTVVLINPRKLKECLVHILLQIVDVQQGDFELVFHVSTVLKQHPDKWNVDAVPGWYVKAEIEAVPADTYASYPPIMVGSSSSTGLNGPLSLCIARSIVAQHLGWIHFGQCDGRLSRAVLYLPRLE